MILYVTTFLWGLDEETQDKLYKNYWSPIEQNFDHLQKTLSLPDKRRLYRTSLSGTTADPFDFFLRDYLMIKTFTSSPLNRVYLNFKKFRQDHFTTSIEEIIANIYDYANHYVNITLIKEEDKQIRQLLLNIKGLGGIISSPLIIEIYNEYYQQNLSREELNKILHFFESYFFRRNICSSTLFVSSSSSIIFTLLMNKPIDKNHYLESFLNTIVQSENELIHLPTDEEFKNMLISKDIYHHPLRSYILTKLENHKRKEFVNIQNYTVEHIIPQNITKSDAWKAELGENWKKIHPRLLHIIGNLTLTGYNSELSNRPFQEKRDMEGGFADSPIRLNRSLAKLEHWNEDEILNRTQILADLALEIWPIPKLPAQKEKSRDNKEKAQKMEQELKEEDILFLE